MADEEHPEPGEDPIDAQLRFLTEGGEAPDLAGLTPEEAAEVRARLDIVAALLNVGPSDVDLRHDPVAIRLGLVEPPTGDPIAANSDDPVTEAVREAERRFSLVATRTPTDGTEFERRFECRSMVENVLVVVAPDPSRYGLCAAHARSAFAMSDELSAVVYCSDAASEAIVFTYGDCHDKIEPSLGWQSGHRRGGLETLGVVLGRYFEQSDPRWEAVQSLEGLDTWEGLAEDVAAVVGAVLQRVAGSTVQLAHKRTARDLVSAIPETTFRGWATQVQRGEADAATLAGAIRTLVEESAP
jgi:hypothetical protein